MMSRMCRRVRHSAHEFLHDDSGFILRGGWAVAFLIFMFIMAVVGQLPWESFLLLLVVSAVLSGIGSLISGGGRSSAASGVPRSSTHTAAPTAHQYAQTPGMRARASSLGRQYAADITEFGDDATAVLRRELENHYGPQAVAANWDELRQRIVAAAESTHS